jgi:hypothetical protein
MTPRNKDPADRVRTVGGRKYQAAKPDRVKTATGRDDWQDGIDRFTPDFVDRPHARRKEHEVSNLLELLDSLPRACRASEGRAG